MKRILIAAIAAIALVSCNSNTAKIDVHIDGAAQADAVLTKLNYNHLSFVDSLKTDKNGDISYKVRLKSENPEFYYLYYGNTKIAGMILLKGDRVAINADTLGHFTISGSEESLLLQKVDDAFATSKAALEAAIEKDEEGAARQAAQIYVNHKRAMLRHIMENRRSITAATTLFQKFNENLPVFGESSDIVLFQSVYDTLSVVYPKSEYIKALSDQIDAGKRVMAMNSKLNEAVSMSFPDVIMNDINGEPQQLSKLTGKVILLSFWSVSQTDHKMFNNELLPIYEAYHDKGLEVYQISLDVDKPTWAAAVKTQKLPWISVNDGLGLATSAVAMYNLQAVPAIFIIGRNGDIIGKDVFDIKELERIIKAAL